MPRQPIRKHGLRPLILILVAVLLGTGLVAMRGAHVESREIAAHGVAAGDDSGYGPERVRTLYAQALHQARLGDEDALETLNEAIGAAWQERHDPRAAAAAMVEAWIDTAPEQREERITLEEAIALHRADAPNEVMLADMLRMPAQFLATRGLLPEAEVMLLGSLAICEEIDPVSVREAKAAHSLGMLHSHTGRYAGALPFFRHALRIKREIAPDQPTTANSLNYVGITSLQLNDVDTAEESFREAEEIYRMHDPDSGDVAHCLRNLGNVQEIRGNMISAGQHYHRAMQVLEAGGAGESSNAGVILIDLGNVAFDLGDLDRAAGHYERALGIFLPDDAQSGNVAACCVSLGMVATGRKDWDAAENYIRRALKIQERHDPDSFPAAVCLGHLGRVELGRGDHAAAEPIFRRSLRIKNRHAPRSTHVADDLICLGRILSIRGEHDEAERKIRDALGIRIEHNRGTSYHAEVLMELAGVHERRGELDLAEKTYTDAWNINLGQSDEALGDEALQSFGDFYHKYSSHLVRIHADRGRGGEAFRILEASRARSLLRMLNERDRIATAAETISLSRARAMQPEGTAYVAFSVGDAGTYGFLAAPDPDRPVETWRVELDGNRLERAVARIRDLAIHVPAAPIVRGVRERELAQLSGKMYRTLFPEKIRGELDRSKRILISPAGPLWELPFKLLAVDLTDAGPVYLGLEKPLGYAQSLSVHSRLLARREAERSVSSGALIVGDPWFGGEEPAKDLVAGTTRSVRGERRYLMEDGEEPSPLPGSGREVELVGNVWNAEPLTERAATEDAVRRRLPRARVVHLATHGLYHPEMVMKSGLLLANPGTDGEDTRNDGCLQAWEFVDDIELNADLMVLSACSSGMGRKVRGEGLVGLTRALQYAGARSIVASQWRIDDIGTADLMAAFHEKVRDGFALDEALRRAMIETRNREETSYPYYWAGFVMVGDGGPLPHQPRQP